MGRSKGAAYAAGMALTVLLTGCGGDEGDSGFEDKSADDILAAAQKAMGDLESAHIDADITSEGSQLVMDLSLSNDGNCEGSVSIDGGNLEVLQVDGEGWFKADAAFWEAQAPDEADQIIAAAGDKWIIDSDGQFTSFCDLESFMKELATPEGDDLKKDGTDEVDGDDVVKLTSDEGTAFIATDGPHHILKIEAGGEDEGDATLSAFDEEIEVEAPADDEVVDLSTL